MKTAVEIAVQAVVYQRRAAEIWIRQYRRSRDAASIRALMFALGRVSGAMDLCRTACREADAALPEELEKIHAECDALFDEAQSIPIMVFRDL